MRDGEALVTITRPGLFAVDINGQMDDQDTGRLPGGHHAGYYQVPGITEASQLHVYLLVSNARF